MSGFEAELFHGCFEAWGMESQLFMLVEECGELIQSASKDIYRNYPERKLKERLEHFAEEMADVQLMIDQFTWKFNLEASIKRFRTLKVRKLAKRLLESRRRKKKP